MIFAFSLCIFTNVDATFRGFLPNCKRVRGAVRKILKSEYVKERKKEREPSLRKTTKERKKWQNESIKTGKEGMV